MRRTCCPRPSPPPGGWHRQRRHGRQQTLRGHQREGRKTMTQWHRWTMLRGWGLLQVPCPVAGVGTVGAYASAALWHSGCF